MLGENEKLKMKNYWGVFCLEFIALYEPRHFVFGTGACSGHIFIEVKKRNVINWERERTLF